MLESFAHAVRSLTLSRPHRRRRGMALLLVMIGMIVCTILTAGFLSTQGTSIGIARNERDAQKCRDIAQTGIDMCYWLIRNKSNWRETMPIGNWLTAYAVGDGAVTVSVADGDSSGSFSDDPTQGVILTSTGSYDNRAYALTATIRPTGGGTVFSSGNLIQGTISIGNSNLTFPAIVDSYNSSVAPYNSFSPGSNASFASNSSASKAFTLYYPSVFRGSFTAGPGAVTANSIYLVGTGATGPSSSSSAAESRVPGNVVAPNTAGLAYQGAWNKTGGTTNAFPAPGQYDSASASGAPITFATSGLYYIVGNLSISSSSGSLVVNSGVNAVVLVGGNTTIVGKVIINGTGQLTLYCNNPATITGSINSSGSTGSFTLLGTSNCTSIQQSGTGTVVGAVYAPQAAFSMPSGAPKFYGAIVASNLTVNSLAQVHFDEALRSLYLSTITGGSAPPGTADYRLTMTGGPGFIH